MTIYHEKGAVSHPFLTTVRGQRVEQEEVTNTSTFQPPLSED